MATSTEGIEVKNINAGDARADMADAITNLAHLIAHEQPGSSEEEIQFAISMELGGFMATGMIHFEREQSDRHVDVRIEE